MTKIIDVNGQCWPDGFLCHLFYTVLKCPTDDNLEAVVN